MQHKTEQARGRWTVTRDGRTLATFPDEAGAVRYLHKVQGQSAWWACRYEGYAIENGGAR
jgi:hypothetical protein